MTKLMTLVLALCLLLSVGVFASGEPSAENAVVPGTYSDGVNTLVIADDMTFSMEKVGQNMDGADFTMLILGVVENGEFVLTNIFDGEFDVFSMATADQLAGDQAAVEAAFAGGLVGGAAPGGVVPGTYTDGVHTLVIADDMTFSLDKTGENMDGAAFVLTVTGTVTADGVFTITGLTDGTVELIEMATEDQLAADLATVVDTYAAATAAAPAGVAPGTYTDGVNTLVIADDLTFVMNKTGENMDGAAFNLTVAGTVTADGVFTITSLKDGDIELIEMATEDQLAADLASVQAAFAG